LHATTAPGKLSACPAGVTGEEQKEEPQTLESRSALLASQALCYFGSGLSEIFLPSHLPFEVESLDHVPLRRFCWYVPWSL